MLKNLEKTVKIASAFASGGLPPFAFGGWGLRPQTPALLLSSTITTLSSLFLALNAFYYPKKGTK